MIDYEKINYEKLAKAHELCEKYYKLTGDSAILESNYSAGCKDYGYSLWIGDVEYWHDKLDAVIGRLIGLTESELKYKAGDIVWLINDEDIPESFKINDVDIAADEKYYLDDSLHGGWWTEEQLYPSREAAIDARIEYWTSLKIGSIAKSTICPKCGNQRVSDGVCRWIGCDYRECQHKGEAIIVGDKLRCLKCLHESYMEAILDGPSKQQPHPAENCGVEYIAINGGRIGADGSGAYPRRHKDCQCGSVHCQGQCSCKEE